MICVQYLCNCNKSAVLLTLKLQLVDSGKSFVENFVDYLAENLVDNWTENLMKNLVENSVALEQGNYSLHGLLHHTKNK
jgi:hypothetical protein